MATRCEHCREPIGCDHVHEHRDLCCDCFDLAMGMTLEALNAERARRGAAAILREWPGRTRIPDGAIRIDLPNITQRREHTCGAACLLAIAAYYGLDVFTEDHVVRLMGSDERGSDPAHLVQAADELDLHHEEFRGMTDDELRRCLDRGRPVVIMLQAWGDRRSYVDHWADGHWVVAIGYDDANVYFEDPMIECMRGCLSYAELAERWHDVEGPDDAHVTRYGLALWRDGHGASAHVRRARALD